MEANSAEKLSFELQEKGYAVLTLLSDEDLSELQSCYDRFHGETNKS